MTVLLLQSTANVAGAKAFYDKYTAVPDAWLPLRDLVVKKRKPRPLFVQVRCAQLPACSCTVARTRDDV